jgi:hypothetical protein
MRGTLHGEVNALVEGFKAPRLQGPSESLTQKRKHGSSDPVVQVPSDSDQAPKRLQRSYAFHGGLSGNWRSKLNYCMYSFDALSYLYSVADTSTKCLVWVGLLLLPGPHAAQITIGRAIGVIMISQARQSLSSTLAMASLKRT